MTQKNGGPALTLLPLADDRLIPLTFEMSMGVKKGDQALKAKLEQAITTMEPKAEPGELDPLYQLRKEMKAALDY